VSAAESTLDPVDEALAPFWRRILDDHGELDLLDVHTHIGANDPDGYGQTPEELLAALGAAGARGVTFPMHEPDGYRAANDAAIATAAASGGLVEALCRVDPKADPAGALAEATRALDAGARGIKLHPRAEGFALDQDGVEELVALANERRLPVLIHAGRGIPALGRDAVRLAESHPRARLILAHAAISDLAWIWRSAAELPNLFVDTSWWNPSDLIALMTLVPSSQILWASDSPYGMPLSSAALHFRCALQAGVGAEALRSIAGEQAARVIAGEDTIVLGTPGGETTRLDPLLERAYTHLISAFGYSVAGGDPSEQLELARLACAVEDSSPLAPICAATAELIALTVGLLPPSGDGPRFGTIERAIVAAMTIARTPDVPLPDLPGAEPPQRAQA
jgi:predicted TIM-barrel fold metal-dependent hydrolase